MRVEDTTIAIIRLAGTRTLRMKKNIFTSILVLIFTANSFGQIGFGLRGGYCGSLSSQELVNGMDREIGFAPTYGFMINYDLDLHFAVSLEANYITYSEILKYSKDFYPYTPDPTEPKAVTTKSTASYLQIPLLGRTTFGDKKLKWYLTFGPYLGIGMSGKRENAMNGTKRLDLTYDATFKPGDFKKYDMGGQVGAGFQYTVGKSGFLFIEARMQIGFFDFYNKLTEEQREAYLGSNAQGYGYFPPGASWRAAYVSAGYFHTFKLPKKNASSGGVKKAGKQRK